MIAYFAFNSHPYKYAGKDFCISYSFGFFSGRVIQRRKIEKKAEAYFTFLFYFLCSILHKNGNTDICLWNHIAMKVFSKKGTYSNLPFSFFKGGKGKNKNIFKSATSAVK